MGFRVEKCPVYRLCGTEHIVQVPSSALNEALVNLEFMGFFYFRLFMGAKRRRLKQDGKFVVPTVILDFESLFLNNIETFSYI